MQCDDRGEPINSYALVTYIPDPLGRFLDDLRRELVPSCVPRAHVTILPPRGLAVSAAKAWEHVASRVRDVAPFRVEAGEVEIFAQTSVIYIGLREGQGELERMHADLNAGPVASVEPFVYHPHITLAQELDPKEVETIREQARRRWAEFRGSRSFPVETMTLVQNTSTNRWMDLAQVTLGAVPVR